MVNEEDEGTKAVIMIVMMVLMVVKCVAAVVMVQMVEDWWNVLLFGVLVIVALLVIIAVIILCDMGSLWSGRWLCWHLIMGNMKAVDGGGHKRRSQRKKHDKQIKNDHTSQSGRQVFLVSVN